MDLRATYDRIADDYAKEHAEYSNLRSSADMLMTRLPQGATVLEIGCGPGMEAKFLADHGMRVTATDVSKRMIEIARVKYPGIDFRVMDITAPIAFAEPFDAIYAQAVLLHFPKEEAKSAIRNLMPHLKPGGFFCASVKERWAGQPASEIKREDDYGYVYERFFQYYTKDEFEWLLQDAGLILVQSRATVIGRTKWLQVLAQKPLHISAV